MFGDAIHLGNFRPGMENYNHQEKHLKRHGRVRDAGAFGQLRPQRAGAIRSTFWKVKRRVWRCSLTFGPRT